MDGVPELLRVDPVLDHLSFRDLVALAGTCKQVRALAKSRWAVPGSEDSATHRLWCLWNHGPSYYRGA